MGKIEIVTEALQQEAKKWLQASDEMEQVAVNVNRLTLEPSAFWCGDSLQVAAEPIYSGFQQLVQQRCVEGSREFEEIAGALRRAADEYDGSDSTSAEALRRIYSPDKDPQS